MVVNNKWPRASHGTGKCVIQIGVPFLLIRNLYHVRPTGTVIVFTLYQTASLFKSTNPNGIDSGLTVMNINDTSVPIGQIHSFYSYI